MSVTTIEHELAAVLAGAGLSERQTEVVSARLGWDGGGAMTLDAAGAAVGYSRERVRQLERRVRVAVETSPPQLPLVREAVRVIEAWAPDSRAHVAKQLWRAGVAAAPFDPAGVLSAAELGRVATEVFTRDGMVDVRHRPSQDNAMMVLARKLASHNGASSVNELARETQTNPDRLRRILNLRPELTWLDERENWFQVYGTHRRLTTNLRKMLSITPSLSIGEVNAGLRRAFRPMVVPTAILRKLCESFAWLVVDGEHSTVTTRLPLDRSRVLSPVELELVTIFQSSGPVLNYTQAIRLGDRAGLNRHSVGVYLTRSPILHTLSRGHYALRGVDGGAVATA